MKLGDIIKDSSSWVQGTPRTEPRSDDILRQLAMDISDDKVFTDRHIRKEDDEAILGQIFMPIVFMDPAAAKNIFSNCGLMYEYYSKASPRGINGYPCFMSFQFLTLEETVRIAPIPLGNPSPPVGVYTNSGII